MTAADVQTGEVAAIDPSLPSVQVALAKAAAAVGAIPKDDLNKDQGFKYRGIERILAAVGPALHRHGIVVLPRVVDVQRDEMVRGASRATWRLVSLTVEYQFVGPAGDVLTAVVLGEGLDNADKAVSKAMTMALKVALLQVLQIADADSDPDATTPPEQMALAAQPPDAPPPEPESLFLSPANVERARAKAAEDGLTADEVADAVETVTNGRTDDLAELLKTEVPALRDAFAHIVQRKQPAEGESPGV